MTMQEIKSIFPEYKTGITSVSDLELVYNILGLDTAGFANLESDNIDSVYIVDGASPVAGKAGARPMLIASFLRGYLSQVGAENLFPKEVTGEISVSELKAIMTKFGSDYTTVNDEIVPTPPEGTPSVITDFTASNNLSAQIKFTWSDSLGASSYDIYKDGSSYKTNVRSGVVVDTIPGTYNFSLLAVSSDNSTESNAVEGISLLPVPEAITDFNASEGATGNVTVTWTDAMYADSYDLYQDGTLVTSGIQSGDSYSFVGTADFMVKAINATGSTDSNIDSGTAV